MSNMTEGTKSEHFYIVGGELSNDSRCSRILVINIAIKNVYCDCERNVCREWTERAMGGKPTRI